MSEFEAGWVIVQEKWKCDFRAELGLPVMPYAILPAKQFLKVLFVENCIKRKGKMLGNSYLNTDLEHRHPQLQLVCSDDGCAFSVLSILSNVLMLPQMSLKAMCCGIVVFSILNNARQTIANTLHICFATTAY